MSSGLLPGPAAAAEPTSTDASTSGSLRFDTSVLDARGGARLEAALREALLVVVAAQRSGDAAQPAARVGVRVLEFDEPRRNYVIELEAGLGEVTRAAVIRCEACNERRLALTVAAAAAEQLGELADASVPAVVAPLAPPAGPSPGARAVAPAARGRGLTRVGVAGTALLGVGVASASAGVALWLRGPTLDRDETRAQLERRDPRPAGAVAIGAGALLGTVGAALLLTDLGRQPARRPTIAIRVTPTFVGFGLRQRF